MSWWRRLLDALSGDRRSVDFDVLPIALIHLDDAGEMRQANRGWEQLSGHRLRDCLHVDHREFLHIEDRPVWQQALRSLAEGAGFWVGNLRYLHRRAELRWVEVRLVRHRDGFVASLADISAQMPEHQQLQARHRSLSNLLDGLPLMVYRCRNNRSWSMEYVSAGCLELTGYPAQRLVDSHCLTFNGLIHPDDRERVWHGVQQALRESRPFAFDYRLLCADGSEKWVSERGRGIYSDLGDLLGLEGVVMERGVEPTMPEELVVGF
ncbi:diguanylate cyclase [Ectopseudomonas toyotomiensis]|uniref:histidine kinase n=1 Tax=Ectopseudomonas toyotomiensis TaxID=554344 RepID=A0A1I5W8J9_9GAMM|nr:MULTISPECIES: PAS domain-containing protein [Pseudomonas]PIA72919.1 diguanylate cyclase [Pseudomonas toyotomiensis]SFQ15576.1 PAS domain S-box-containing protein [Pseudomonas toyotomiensis]